MTQDAPLFLFKLCLTHYSQKDRAEAIVTYLIATDEDLVIQYVEDNTSAGWLEREAGEYEEEDGPPQIWPEDDYWDENPDAAARAEALGLTISLCDWGDREGQPESVAGEHIALIKWNRGDYEEVSDLYYGATQYNWEEGVPISFEDTEPLIRLGVAEYLKAAPG
jgi:hypothetical protein